MNNNLFINYILNLLSKYILDIKVNNKYLKIKIELDSLQFFMKFFFLHSFLRYKLLIDISCIDLLERVKRFEVNYILLSSDFNSRIILSVDLKQTDILTSLTKIFNGSNWMEREIWDMYGIFFSGHSDLRRILTDYGFEGYPFRKDFPLNGYLEIRYDENRQYMIYEPIELMQNMRYFNFINPLLKKYII
jgi:NADH/F420H2 dehydrogenase subunit C